MEFVPRRQELEAQHQAEEEKRKAQERTDNLLMAQLTLEEIEKQEEQMMAFEQERRDFEMAFRLARVGARTMHDVTSFGKRVSLCLSLL